jgi:hypothetical protein
MTLSYPMGIKLHNTDFVIVNKKTKQPIEPFDVVYSCESLAEFLNSGEYQIAPDGDYEFVSMTELPESLQKRYREEINKLTDRGRR